MKGCGPKVAIPFAIVSLFLLNSFIGTVPAQETPLGDFVAPPAEDAAEPWEPTPASSKSDEFAPAWSATLSPPLVAATDATNVLVAISSAGEGSGPTPVELIVQSTAGRATVENLVVPGLEEGQSWQTTVTVSLGEGLTTLTLRLAEFAGASNTGGVLARSWAYRPFAAPIATPPPVFFEDAEGVDVPPASSQDPVDVVEVSNGASEEGRVLLHKGWADSRVPWLAVANGSYGIEERDGESYYAFVGSSVEAVVASLESFEPRVRETRFGRGSGESILLAERPMGIRLLEVPHVKARTTNASENHWSDRLLIDLDDGDPAGQDVWFNATWLESHGLTHPQFACADGTPIPARRVGGHWLASPPHFSAIQLTNGAVSSFDVLNDSPYSALFTAPAGWTLRPDRRDSLDESVVSDFVPHAAWTLSSVLDVFDQGDGQAAYPLGLGNRSERANPAPDDHDFVRRGLGFLYKSNAYHSQRPEIQAFYAGEDGVRHQVWTWTTTENPTGPYEFTSVKLQLRQSGNEVFFELFDSAAGLDRSSAVAVSSLPMAFVDSLFVGNEEGALGTSARLAWLHSRDFTFTVEGGSLVHEEFGQAAVGQWQTSQNAALLATDGFLRLVPALPDQAGLAAHATEARNPRMSVEFRYRVGPPATPEGVAFLFYKNTDYAPASRQAMGAEDGDLVSTLGHEGYALALPTGLYACRPHPGGDYIALLKDTNCNVVAHSPAGSPDVHDESITSSGWHTVNLVLNGQRYAVYYDGKIALKGTAAFDRTFGGLGFSAATGSYGANHDVDYVYASVADFLTAANHAPYVPTDPVPLVASNVLVPPTTLTLKWASGDIDGNPVTYKVLADETNPPTTVRCTTSSTTCDLTGLEAGKHYYWRIEALDGVTSILGPVWDFLTILNGAPFSPWSPSPADGATRQSFFLGLTWKNGDPNLQPVTDTVFFGTDNPPATAKCSNVADRFCWAPGLAAGTTYYWRVQSASPGGTTLGPVWRFTTDHPPAVPNAPSPLTGATAQRISLSLSWLGGDPDGTLPTYTVAFGTANPPVTVKCAASTANVCPTGVLSYDTLYFWRVTATDGRSTVQGPVWSFRTDVNRIPFVPSNPFPSNGTTNWSVSPFTLTWSGGDPNGLAPKYTVTFTSTGPPSDLPLVPAATSSGTWCKDVTIPSCTLGVLAERTTYQWKVVSNDGHLTSQGPLWTFLTGVNHPSFVPTNPVPDETTTGVDVNPRLEWTGGDPDRSNPAYTVFLDTKNPPGTPRCNGVVAASCTVTGLQYNTTYYWRVSPTDGLVRLPGRVWNFTTKQSPIQHAPNTPSDPSPPSRTLLAAGNVSVRWTGGDLDGGRTRYTVYLENDRFSGPVCVNVETPNCTLTNLTSPKADILNEPQWGGGFGQHQWWVVATDGTQTVSGPAWELVTPPSDAAASTLWDCTAVGTASPPIGHIWIDQGFLVDCASPTDNTACSISTEDCVRDRLKLGRVLYEPADPTPVDGAAQIVPVGVHLQWEGENPADRGYDVYLGTSATAMNLECVDVNYTDCLIYHDLEWGKEYYWQVKLHDLPRVSVAPIWRFVTSLCMDRWCPTPDEQFYWRAPPPIPEIGVVEEEQNELEKTDDGTGGLPPPLPLPVPLTPLAESNAEELRKNAFETLNGDGDECAAQSEDNEACTVVFIHGIGLPDLKSVDGWSSVLYDRAFYEGPQSSDVRNWKVDDYFALNGYKNVVQVGYYGGDCGVTTTNGIQDAVHAFGRGHYEDAFSSGHAQDSKASRVNGCDGTPLVHTLNTDIRHLAYHLAWYIFDQWSDPDHNVETPGTVIDVVAHSMGGIVLRTAMQMVEDGQISGVSHLLIEDAITFGSPHTGTILGCHLYFRDAWHAYTGRWLYMAHSATQADQLCSRSSFMKEYLAKTALLPQPGSMERSFWQPKYTDWSLIAATGRSLGDCCPNPKSGDFFIQWESATGMPYAPHKYLYVEPKYRHTEFAPEINDAHDADVESWGADKDGKRPPRSRDNDAPRFRPLVYHLAGSLE